MREGSKKTRVCGARCHNAKRAKCGCWCGGLFHGAAGQEAREAFREVVTNDPKGEYPDDMLFVAGLKAARAVGQGQAA